MKRADATNAARAAGLQSGLTMAVVREGPHADEFAQLDADGESYGYCPSLGVPMLYPHGVVVLTLQPTDEWRCPHCDNKPEADGFSACDEKGVEMEPGPEWKGHYVCTRCNGIHMGVRS